MNTSIQAIMSHIQLLYIIHRCIRYTNNAHTYTHNIYNKQFHKAPAIQNAHCASLQRKEERTCSCNCYLKAAGLSPQHACKIRFYIILLEEGGQRSTFPPSIPIQYILAWHARRCSFLDLLMHRSLSLALSGNTSANLSSTQFSSSNFFVLFMRSRDATTMLSLNSLTNPLGFLVANGFVCSSVYFIYIPFTAKLLEFQSVLLFRHIGSVNATWIGSTIGKVLSLSVIISK